MALIGFQKLGDESAPVNPESLQGGYSGGPPNLTVTSLEQVRVPASHTL